MIKFNLVYPDQSEVKFKINKFPDGQQDVVIIGWEKPGTEILIISRFNSWLDLELIVAAKKALDPYGLKVSLNIPYLLGARSDRKFVTGGNSYLVDVLAPIINSLNFESVIVYDVHSDVAAACIKNLTSITNSELVRDALKVISPQSRDVVLISPDAGAYKKIYGVAKDLGIPNVITAMKYRDPETGTILSTEINIPANLLSYKFVIVDDICDGGRSFIELSKILQAQLITEIYLVVSHGIFSAGYDELNKHFIQVHTTNSVRDIIDVKVIRQHKII